MQSESGFEELRECQARDQVWCYASVYACVNLAFLACRQGNRDCREVKVKVSCAGQLYSKPFSTLFAQCTILAIVTLAFLGNVHEGDMASGDNVFHGAPPSKHQRQ